MHHARPHSRKPGTGFEPRQSAAHARLRFDRVLHLETGDAVGAFARTDKRFEERAVFGPAGQVAESACPAIWLSDHLEDVAAASDLIEMTNRPLHLKAPMAALGHANTAIACHAAVRRTRLCAQEFVLEFADAAFASSREDHVARVQGLRRRGFRVGIDARKSWLIPLCGNLRLMIDSIRIDASSLESDDALKQLVDVAHTSGISVIAQGARWRDANWLCKSGVGYGMRLQADA